MADVDLRPMSLGEVLDRTFSLYKAHFWLFAGITALPFFLVLLAEVGVAAIGLTGAKVATSHTPLSPSALAGAFGGGSLLVFLYLLMIGAAHAATVFAVSDLYLGRSSSIRGSFEKVGWKVFRVLLLFFLIGLIIVVAFVAVGMLGYVIGPILIGFGFLLLVPIVIFFCRLAVAIPAAMLEDLGAVRALERSVHLTKGHAGQIFVIFLLVVTATYVALLVLQFPVLIFMMSAAAAHHAPSFGLQVLQHLAEFVSQVLVGPIGTIAVSLMYYNLRVRKEAFDIQHLMASMTSNPEPNAPSVA